MLSEAEAVILATANNRIADLERRAGHSIATTNQLLINEKASRRREREAFELTIREMAEEIELLREIAKEAMARA